MERKIALITGITGQDGSYLSELLLAKGYEVHGLRRRVSLTNTSRLEHLRSDEPDADLTVNLHYGDVTSAIDLRRLLETVKPDEVYHLAAMSHVGVSFDTAEYTADVGVFGSLRLFEAVLDFQKAHGKQIKVYNAGTSEMLGSSEAQHDENSPFNPRSPYGVAKVAANYYAKYFRDTHNLFISNGILFNHESPRRGEAFVSRKITRAAGRIRVGLQDKLYLGNLDAIRDWGFAGDYVEAMWMMMQQDTPDDFVIATGSGKTVKEFLQATFSRINDDYHKYVVIDDKHRRPSEIDILTGNSAKARATFGWKPSVGFEALVDMMVAHDLELATLELDAELAAARRAKRVA